MANRLSRKTIDAMFATYADRRCVEEVARKHGCSHRTVERYRRIERWDERLEQVRASAQQRADYTLSAAMAQSLSLIRELKSKFAKAIDQMKILGDDVTISDVERLVRLEAFVLGGSESRHEVVDQRFVGWTDQELEDYARTGKRPDRSSRSAA